MIAGVAAPSDQKGKLRNADQLRRTVSSVDLKLEKVGSGST
jgi:hypothetical protein